MKTLFKTFLSCGLIASGLFFLSACDDDEDPGPQLTGNTKEYALGSVSDAAVSGTVTFAERDDDQVVVTIQLNGTQSGASHPAHIHANSAAEGGSIVLDLTDVNGADGKSETIVSTWKDGTALAYEDLLGFDGHVNVHASASDLNTLIAQGDIGSNELTGDSKIYNLHPVADPAISGTATFAKRQNGTTLVTVALSGPPSGLSHASHIHANTIAQGGPIVINLENVDGTTWRAVSDVDSLNNGTPITYEQLLDFNGYLNVHTGSTFVVQGDIGGNELTGDKKVYTMQPVIDPTVTGTVTWEKRKKGTTLVTVDLDGIKDVLSHASHFHATTIAQGGAITINLKAVPGATGFAQTSVDTLNNGTPITYEDLLNYDGYINVHSGSSFVAQVDIGQNELTGVHQHYALNAVNGSGIAGEVTFDKRKNGKAQVTIAVTGTTAGVNHLAHIHGNDAATGGPVVLDLKNVNGTTGLSVTSINTLNDTTPITYDQLVGFNGHVNVHMSTTDLTIAAQADIGSNAD